jgi:microcystin-dependent protein
MARTQIKTPGIADGSITTAKLDSSIVGALVPVGGIIMWSGITVPTGWSLCNGSNGTPDLRNRFIVAADSLTKTGTTSQSGTSPYDPGDIGGEANATLVSHSHTATSSVDDPGHAHSYISSRLGASRNDTSLDDYIYQQGATTGSSVTLITVATSISVEGSVATDKNLPPYYALAFIMRTS